jgi:mono/diheme cytochrome c family protein
VLRSLLRFGLAVLLAAVAHAAFAASPQVDRGRYLVAVGGCADCHTPGSLIGKPDRTRDLGGSDVGFAIPGQGVFVAPNLTPDRATGLGGWTDQEVITALTKGERPDGRVLAGVMPWRGLAALTQSDALAIVAYLRSLPPVTNKVAGPFGPGETPTTLVMTVLPGEAFAKLSKP